MKTHFGGYTIVEVMIFLAVTTGLFVAVAATFSGRQAAAEFSTASRDMESKLQDIINDISTGYYSNPGNFTCTNSVGIPSFNSTSNQQGKNDDCIFIGRIIHFDLSGSNGSAYNLYTAAGVRQINAGTSNRDVIDLTEAKPRLIGRTNAAADVIIDDQQIPPGLKFANMFYNNGASWVRVEALGFFSTFARYGAQGIQPGTVSVNVLPIDAVGNTPDQVVAAVAAITELSVKNPTNGVIICFNGDSANKYSELQIGGTGRDLSTTLTIKSGSCPATR